MEFDDTSEFLVLARFDEALRAAIVHDWASSPYRREVDAQPIKPPSDVADIRTKPQRSQWNYESDGRSRMILAARFRDPVPTGGKLEFVSDES
jgi:hypothetical protein